VLQARRRINKLPTSLDALISNENETVKMFMIFNREFKRGTRKTGSFQHKSHEWIVKPRMSNKSSRDIQVCHHMFQPLLATIS
jgi:hypothetical protein